MSEAEDLKIRVGIAIARGMRELRRVPLAELGQVDRLHVEASITWLSEGLYRLGTDISWGSVAATEKYAVQAYETFQAYVMRRAEEEEDAPPRG